MATVRIITRRLLSLEAFVLIFSASFFACLMLYLKPDARELPQSTTVATRALASDRTNAWTTEERAGLPVSYRLKHIRCMYADPVDTEAQKQYISYGRIPLLFVHGNAGTFDTATSLASLLPLGKWPAMGPSRGSASNTSMPVPALGMTVYSVDMNEDANIHSGAVLTRQADFVARSITFLHQRFLAYHLGALPGRRQEASACNSHTVLSASADYAAGAGTDIFAGEGTTPVDFCRSMWREIDAVERHGIWVVAHSMGGIVARMAVVLGTRRASSVLPIAGIITINTPHRYPPIFIDSVMVQVYQDIHNYWANAGTECSSIVQLPRMRQGCENSSTTAARRQGSNSYPPPVISIHTGSMDEQVFFESTRLEQQPGQDLQRNTNVSSACEEAHMLPSSLFTGHMVDCGMMFDHNSVLWSLEFMEPLVETIWRMQKRIYSMYNSMKASGPARTYRSGETSPTYQALPEDLMATSLLSVIPSREYSRLERRSSQSNDLTCTRGVLSECSSGLGQVVIPIDGAEGGHGAGKGGAEEAYVVFAPIRARSCACLDLAEAAQADSVDGKRWHVSAILQSPLLQYRPDIVGLDRLTSWSLLYATRRGLASTDIANVAHSIALAVDKSCMDEAAVALPGRGVAVKVASGSSFEASRGSIFRFSLRPSGDNSVSSTYCVLAPKEFFDGGLNFPRRSHLADVPHYATLLESVLFFRLSSTQTHLWRSYTPQRRNGGDGSSTMMMLLCQLPAEDSAGGASISVERVDDVVLRWANILVVYEGGPLLMFCSVLSMAIKIFFSIPSAQSVEPFERHTTRGGSLVAVVACFITTTLCTFPGKGSADFVPSIVVAITAAFAGGGLGIALFTINGAIQQLIGIIIVRCAPRGVGYPLMWSIACPAACLLFAVNNQTYWLIACWCTTTLLTGSCTGDASSSAALRSLKITLSSAIVLCFHASGSVFHLKNRCMGSDIEPLAPEHAESATLLLVATMLVAALPVVIRRDAAAPSAAQIKGTEDSSLANIHYVACWATSPQLVLVLLEYATTSALPMDALLTPGGSARLPQYWDMSRCALCGALVSLLATLDVALR